MFSTAKRFKSPKDKGKQATNASTASATAATKKPPAPDPLKRKAPFSRQDRPLPQPEAGSMIPVEESSTTARKRHRPLTTPSKVGRLPPPPPSASLSTMTTRSRDPRDKEEIESLLDTARKEKRVVEAHWHVTEGELRETQRHVARLTAKLKSVEAKEKEDNEAPAMLNTFRRKVIELQGLLKEGKARVEELMAERDSLAEKLRRADDLSAKLTDTTALLSREKARSADLQSRVSRMSAEIPLLQSSLDALQDKENADGSTSASDVQLASYRKTISELQDAMDDLVRERDKSEAIALEQAEERGDAIADLHKRLRDQEDLYRARIMDLEIKLATLQPSTLPGARPNRRLTSDQLEEVASLHRQITEAREEGERLRAVIQGVEGEREKAESELRTRVEEVEALRRDREEAARCRREEARLATAMTEGKVAASAADAATARGMWKGRKDEVDRLRAQVESVRAQGILERERLVKLHAESIAGLERAGSEVTRRHRESEARRMGRVTDLEAELRHSQLQVQLLRKRLEELSLSSASSSSSSPIPLSVPVQASASEDASRRELLLLQGQWDVERSTMQDKLLDCQGALSRLSKENVQLKDLVREVATERTSLQEHLELQTDFIRSRYPAIAEELVKASDGALANPNTRLRIKNLSRMKEDIVALKEANIILTKQAEEEISKACKLEGELRAFKSVGGAPGPRVLRSRAERASSRAAGDA